MPSTSIGGSLPLGTMGKRVRFAAISARAFTNSSTCPWISPFRVARRGMRCANGGSCKALKTVARKVVSWSVRPTTSKKRSGPASPLLTAPLVWSDAAFS
eukprot:scaffold212936_cov33-Tisochrysis_lutea.AAC.2